MLSICMCMCIRLRVHISTQTCVCVCLCMLPVSQKSYAFYVCTSHLAFMHAWTHKHNVHSHSLQADREMEKQAGS